MKRITDGTPLWKVLRLMLRGDPDLDVLLTDYLRERDERLGVIHP